MSSNSIHPVTLIEFFSARYRERQGVKGRHQLLEALAFEALAQIEWENIEAQFDGNEPVFDFSGTKDVPFVVPTEPIPFELIGQEIAEYVTAILKSRVEHICKYQNLGGGLLFRPNPELFKNNKEGKKK